MLTFRKWKQIAHKINRRELIDYGSYTVAIIGIIVSGYETFQGNLDPTQAASIGVIVTTLSQAGSMINKVVDTLEEFPDSE